MPNNKQEFTFESSKSGSSVEESLPCTSGQTSANAPRDSGETDTALLDLGCCHHKETPRSKELQASLQKRLNRAIGQLNGVKSMIDDNRYCGDVLTQLAAAESAVHRVSALMLQNHLETCVVDQIKQGNVEVIDEVMLLLKKFSH